MAISLSRPSYATVAATAVAATVFATSLGSSSVPGLVRVGGTLRWIALLALLVVGAVAALARGERLRLPLAVGAGAVWLVALALVSSLWSVEPVLTAKRGISLGLVLGAAGLLAYAAAGRPLFAERLVEGIVAGAAAVALAGLPLLALDHGAAVHAASYGVPARYQGIGQSPNTVALLLALAVPLAAWIAIARHRLLGIAALVLFAGTLAASASRGGLVGALVGSLIVVALTSWSARVRVGLAALACVVFAGAVAAGRLSHSLPAPSGGPSAPAAAAPQPRYADVDRSFPLGDDVGRPLPGQGDNEGTRTLLGSSGRTAVWDYALGQVLQRPVSGFGFGTEDRVFFDRFANFQGDRVENSYIGLLLQLGAVGLASFVTLIAGAVLAGRRALRGRGFGVAAVGALAGGLVVALVQSYVYSAGDIAALTFWVAAALCAVAAVPAWERA